METGVGDRRRISCYDEKRWRKVRSRSLGIVFIAAVIVPSILLAVLAIRAAGREEAFIERQLAATLGADVTHTAALALSEVNRVTGELGAGVDVPAGANYARILAAWKKSNPLVSVPFLLSPTYRILWPRSDGRLDADQKKFLLENGDFLSDKTATSVLENIAVRYQAEILREMPRGTVAAPEMPRGTVAAPEMPRGTVAAEAARNQGVPETSTISASGSTSAPAPLPAAPAEAAASPADSKAAPTSPPSSAPAKASRAAEVGAAPASPSAGSSVIDASSSGSAEQGLAAKDKVPAAAANAPPAAAQNAGAAAARQVALDAFAQSADIQNKVYQLAREKGDTVSPRVVQPTAPAVQTVTQAAEAAPMAASSPAPMAASSPAPAAAPSRVAPAALNAAPTPTQTPADREVAVAAPTAPKKDSVPTSDEQQAAGPGGAAPASEAQPAPVEARKEAASSVSQPSQYVITSQLLSEIASTGDHGLIPRFIGDKLVFLFWEREGDGRIAGCELAGGAFRERIRGILTATYTPQRILTLLDENGIPLAAPPDVRGLDWRRPFVSEPVGETLPRWEAAAYLTAPDSITDRARSSSLIIWILVLILLVSVAGGGTMVLSSVYGEVRLAQKKATFVTNVSHELKTPLTSISLFVELLRQKRPLAQAKREQYLSLMAAETERLTRLINNVLDFSSVQRGAKRYTLRTLDAAAVASEILESQRVRLESRGFSVSCAANAGGLFVRADPEALKQILLNLLVNAEKYSADRKEISVEVNRGPEGAVLTRVRDRGIGVAEKDRERIFREFYRVNDSLSSGVQGTGLGLTIARRIARDLGGDITCEPREGGGSDFVVRLPGVSAEEEEA